MLSENFVYFAILLPIIGEIGYIYETLKGYTQPNRVTWTLWAVAPMIVFIAGIQHGFEVQSLLTFSAGFGPLLVVTASFFNKNSYWRITKFDMLCGIFAVFALLLWVTTNNPLLAIIFSILGDALAAIPTIVKSYTNPETESYMAFFFSVIGSIVTLLTISRWEFSIYAFPMYLAIVNAVIFSTIFLRQKAYKNLLKLDIG